MTRILIIMPALNEEESLPATLKELREVVDDVDILVIDDGSTDATAEVATRAGAVSAQLPFTLGVGGAVRVGLHYAQRNGYDRAVVIDADGQHDPAGITALLEALDRGADMAAGSRFAAGIDDYPVGRTRRQAMRFLGAIVRALTGQRFSDVTSAFRAFDRPVIELLARSTPSSTSPTRSKRSSSSATQAFASTRCRSACAPEPRACRRRVRVKLVINYLRLLIGILGSASRRARLRKDEA